MIKTRRFSEKGNQVPGDSKEMTFSNKGVEASKDGTFKVRGKVQSPTGPVAKTAKAVLDKAKEDGVDLDKILDTDDDQADIKPFLKYSDGKKAPSKALTKPTELGAPGIYGVFEDGEPEDPVGVYQVDSSDISNVKVDESRKRKALKRKSEGLSRGAGFNWDSDIILSGGLADILVVPNGVALVYRNQGYATNNVETVTLSPNVGTNIVPAQDLEDFSIEAAQAIGWAPEEIEEVLVEYFGPGKIQEEVEMVDVESTPEGEVLLESGDTQLIGDGDSVYLYTLGSDEAIKLTAEEDGYIHSDEVQTFVDEAIMALDSDFATVNSKVINYFGREWLI